MVTVELSEPVWRDLMLLKNPGESFDDVLRREFGLGNENQDTPATHTRVEHEPDGGEEATAELDFPRGKDRDACRDAIEATEQYLEDKGAATMREIVTDVMPSHPLGYDVPELEPGTRYRGAWWRRIVKPGLEASPTVEKPGPGKSEWRWRGE